MNKRNSHCDTVSWRRFQDGDQEALGENFEKRFQELYFYGLKLVLLEDLVKDTIQDLFTDLWSRKEKSSKITNINAYLFVSLGRELIRRASKIHTMWVLKKYHQITSRFQAKTLSLKVKAIGFHHSMSQSRAFFILLVF